MVVVSNKIGALQVKAYRGDFKTLVAWTFNKSNAKNLAGFTIRCAPQNGQAPYYLYNMLQFKVPSDHAQDENEPSRSSVNAPFHKFRWIHVPGQDHQGLDPFRGVYTYTVFPRYFDNSQHMLPLDEAKGVPVTIDVKPFTKGKLQVAFTRGYVQSQAFVRHFGKSAKLEPPNRPVVYDPAAIQAGISPEDQQPFTYADVYDWCGFTAREVVFKLLKEVESSPTLKLDVFAYDLKEPDLIAALARLAPQGRLRVILDDAGLHHNKTNSKFEDKAALAVDPTSAGVVKRGNFNRYAHDKVFVISDANGPLKVLTGSTNFAVTGMYVNSNHVLVYEDREIARFYAGVFQDSWIGEVKKPAFLATNWSTGTFSSTGANTPATEIHFSPHSAADAQKVLDDMAARISGEPARPDSNKKNSVMFAVMEMGKTTTGPVVPALDALYAVPGILTFGITDSTDSVTLYAADKAPGEQRQGLKVTGKPKDVLLSPPFNQVPGISGHQVHHKFVVCSFNGDDPVVYCGSSNLALGGEKDNGDNLIAIRDADVATVFAIEATALVDHFSFLDSRATPPAAPPAVPPPAVLSAAAKSAGIFLGTTDAWAKKYFTAKDLHQLDRVLFGE